MMAKIPLPENYIESRDEAINYAQPQYRNMKRRLGPKESIRIILQTMPPDEITNLVCDIFGYRYSMFDLAKISSCLKEWSTKKEKETET
jgi:hypothetical protein